MKDVGIYALPVLLILADEMMYHRKTGVFPSQQRIVNELGEKFGIYRVIRTYNRWAALIEEAGLIRRKKRHKLDKLLGWIFRSSLYTITGLGWNFIIRNSKYTWDQFNSLTKEATATFRKPKKNRKVFRPSGELTSIKDILGSIKPDTS